MGGEAAGRHAFLLGRAQKRVLPPFLRPDEARRQIAVAKKHGLKLEWYVRKQDLQFFENALGDLLDDITQIVY
jgi:hypothetical protein